MAAVTARCPKGHLNSAAQKFCGQCGTSLLGVCPEGHPNPEGQSYCGECGAYLSDFSALTAEGNPNQVSDTIAINSEAELKDATGSAVSPLKAARANRGTRRLRTLILAGAGVVVAVAIGLITFMATYQGGLLALPISGVNEPNSVAVDNRGAVYVTDPFNHRVVKLEAGSSTQRVLPFTDLKRPRGVAIDGDGAVYVADTDRDQVLKLASGSSEQTVLPFTDLFGPRGVAVDSDGTVYVADTNHHRVLKLEAGSSKQTVLPFIDLVEPCGLAVDDGGAVYVTDIDSSHRRVLKLEAGSNAQTVLPFRDLSNPVGVAVDRPDAVYVVNDERYARVIKLAGGSDRERAVLPLDWPQGIAVDSGGALYVTDSDRRVLKLAAQCIYDHSEPQRTSSVTKWLCRHVNPVRAFMKSWS